MAQWDGRYWRDNKGGTYDSQHDADTANERQAERDHQRSMDDKREEAKQQKLYMDSALNFENSIRDAQAGRQALATGNFMGAKNLLEKVYQEWFIDDAKSVKYYRNCIRKGLELLSVPDDEVEEIIANFKKLSAELPKELYQCYLKLGEEEEAKRDYLQAFCNFLIAAGYSIIDNCKDAHKSALFHVTSSRNDVEKGNNLFGLCKYVQEAQYNSVDSALKEKISALLDKIEQGAEDGNMDALYFINEILYDRWYVDWSSFELPKSLLSARNETAEAATERHLKTCLKYAKLGKAEALCIMGRHFWRYNSDGIMDKSRKEKASRKEWYEKAVAAGSSQAQGYLEHMKLRAEDKRTYMWCLGIGFALAFIIYWCFAHIFSFNSETNQSEFHFNFKAFLLWVMSQIISQRRKDAKFFGAKFLSLRLCGFA